MNELIQITRSTINGAEVNSVNARDLHTALEIKRDFNAWMSDTKEILDTYEEGVDYIRTTLDRNNSVVVVKKSLNLRGKQAEYIMTLDMCKHISMMSRSEKGREVRQYFIDVEKQSSLPSLPQTYIEALEALTASEKEKLALSSKIIEKDKVILAVADLNIRAGDVTIGDFSKNLAIEGLGQNNLFSWLKARGFLMMNTAPYQQYVERGYFVRKPSNKKINGEVRYTTMLTPKGTIWLTKMLKAEFDLD